MELVLNNPFRILGLPASSSARDVAKRVSDLETFAELGKSKSFTNDFPGLGPIDRCLESIKDAARKIEQAEGRLFHSFFWFRSGDSVDEMAFESLNAGNVEEASDLWSKQLAKKGGKKYTWRLNRAVLRLLTAAKVSLDSEGFDEALEDLGFVIDDDLDQSIQAVLGGNEAGLNREAFWKRMIDELLALVHSYPTKPYGKYSISIVDSFWSFPDPAKDYAASKVINPLIETIQEAIARSESRRGTDDFESIKKKNGLDGVETIIQQLHEVLDENDLRFQSIANAYANEICSCAVHALNEHEDPIVASMLINWAAEMPSYARVENRITENKENIDRWVASAREEEIFKAIRKKLDVKIYSLTQASSILEGMKTELAKIKAQVSRENEAYIAASSACAHYMLSFLIDTVNEAQEAYPKTKTLNELRSIFGQTATMTRQLLMLDLDGETRVRVNTNVQTIENINSKLTIASQANTMSNSGADDFWSQIPGWVWVIGVIVLLSMCGK